MSNKKQNKKILYGTIVFILLVVIIASVIFVINNKLDNKQNMETSDNKEENVSVEELMQDINSSADPNIYDIESEYDGRKVLSVKDNVQFSVAFAGKIKSDLTNVEEAKTITEQQLPTESGIYLKNQENKVLQYINKYAKCKYQVTEQGYLKLNEKTENNEFDDIIQKAIESNNLYIIYCDGEIKIVDNVTGEIR